MQEICATIFAIAVKIHKRLDRIAAEAPVKFQSHTIIPISDITHMSFTVRRLMVYWMQILHHDSTWKANPPNNFSNWNIISTPKSYHPWHFKSSYGDKATWSCEARRYTWSTIKRNILCIYIASYCYFALSYHFEAGKNYPIWIRHFEIHNSWMKIASFKFEYHWCLFLRIQLTICIDMLFECPVRRSCQVI